MMIISRAPLRISLGGGGTDLPAYSDKYGGLVVSTSIDRYVYVILTGAPDEVMQITSADAASVMSRREPIFDSALFWGADHRLALETTEHFNVSGGCRIFIASEVPPGTGLGSSSSTAIALITALSELRGISLSKAEKAELACHIEIERMGMPIGRQDQYASAFGGFNIMRFSPEGTEVIPCQIPDAAREVLQQGVLLFFTGMRRRSTDILEAQRQATEKPKSNTLEALHDIKAIALDMIRALEAGDLATFGTLLDLSWERKRQLAPGITNDTIDGWYRAAKSAGAIGGKITGAGGGGFLMVFVEPDARRSVIQRLNEEGLVWVDVEFECKGGATVLAPPRTAFA
jgi:D-glycero-alpha-D-manno-heptose-7-phosphate kinase